MTETKSPGVALTISVDFHDDIVPALKRDKVYVDGDTVRAEPSTGWYYEAITPGRTSKVRPPKLPRARDEAFKDGAAEFKAVHPNDATLESINTAVWTVPSPLTLDSQTETDFEAFATISGGEAGKDYNVVVKMTPTSGDPIERSVTLQVRDP